MYSWREFKDWWLRNIGPVSIAYVLVIIQSFMIVLLNTTIEWGDGWTDIFYENSLVLGLCVYACGGFLTWFTLFRGVLSGCPSKKGFRTRSRTTRRFSLIAGLYGSLAMPAIYGLTSIQLPLNSVGIWIIVDLVFFSYMLGFIVIYGFATQSVSGDEHDGWAWMPTALICAFVGHWAVPVMIAIVNVIGAILRFICYDSLEHLTFTVSNVMTHETSAMSILGECLFTAMLFLSYFGWLMFAFSQISRKIDDTTDGGEATTHKVVDAQALS